MEVPQYLSVVEGHLNIRVYMSTMYYTHHKYNVPDVRSLLVSALLVNRLSGWWAQGLILKQMV